MTESRGFAGIAFGRVGESCLFQFEEPDVGFPVFAWEVNFPIIRHLAPASPPRV